MFQILVFKPKYYYYYYYYITTEVHTTILEITWLQPFNKGYKDSKKPQRNPTENSTGSPLVDRQNMQLMDVL